jgi:hypothetical protein
MDKALCLVGSECHEFLTGTMTGASAEIVKDDGSEDQRTS